MDDGQSSSPVFLEQCAGVLAAVAVVVPVVIALGLLVGRAAETWVLDAPEAFRRVLSGRAAD